MIRGAYAHFRNCLCIISGYFLRMVLYPLIRRNQPSHGAENKANGSNPLPSKRLKNCGLLLALAVSTLSGCVAKDGIRTPSAAATVTTENAFVLPPPGGPSILNVVQHEFNNAVQQDIYLFTSAANSGQNFLEVTFFGPVGVDSDSKKGLGYASVRDSTIDRDMHRALPGVAMQRSGIYVQNNYGPFGYATGKSAQGDTCLYAWQQVRSSDNARSGMLNRGTVQVRLRLCDSRATPEQLLRIMYGYTITGTFSADGWNPYDSAPTVDPSLGRTGNPIYPVTSAADQPPPAYELQSPAAAVATHEPAQRPAPVVTRRPVVTQQVVAPAPVAAPVIRPIGPLVPSPVAVNQTNGTSPAVIVPTPTCGTNAGPQTETCK
jgi:hypothetical protein